MRSRPDVAWRLIVALTLITLSMQLPIAQQAADGVTAIGDDEIANALETIKADPNLATERTIRMLGWRDTAPRQASEMPAWLAWIGGLFRWIDQSARVLVWIAAIVLAGVLAAYVVRMFRSRERQADSGDFIAPTHVQDLDIRPETLPADIGAAARRLWDRGDQRAALALLYRGLLSRLAHVHQVPIRDSSTEGDCLALAATYLSTGRYDYASRLIPLWQRFVYGHAQAPTDIVYGLCDDFAFILDAASPESAA